MAEGGEDYSFDNKFDPDDFLLDSDSEALSDEDEESDDAPVSEDEGDTDEDEEISLEELERTLSDDEELQEQMDGDEQTEGNIPVPHNIRKILCFVNFFYGHKVRPTYLNILTDFADAEIFLIDGDSLLLELLEETTLDWTNGGQFLHLTYLVESFLQYFTDKGGVFHVVFFKDMENMWGSQPSMLLARQALILHLQYNTPFTVVSSIDNCWGKQWKDYVDDKCPAFLLLTDAESIPWEATSKEQKAVEFFFRSLLCHSLGQELNCVFMSGIEMTATKVMGFYTQSSSDQKYLFRQFEKQVHEIWQFLVRLCQQEAPLDVFEFPIGLKEKVQTAPRSPPKGGCRELATVLACGKVLSKLLDSCETSTETVKPKEDIIKLFLLHSILLKKLPLKYRSHSINSELLDQSCKTDDGEGFPFREFHINLWKILKLIQEENDGEETSLMATGNALDMKSVADMMDGRLVHSLFLAVLEQGTLGLRANSLPEDVIEEAETAWSKVVSAANSDALKPQFFPLLAFDATKICGSQEGGPGTNVGTVTLRRLLDVDNGLVNEYAGEIRTRLNAMADDSTTKDVFVNGKEFDERYHWHTRKLLSDDYDRTRETIKEKPPDNERQRFFFYRNKQTYVRFLGMYGNSLLGGSGKEKVIIVKEDGTDKKKGKDKTNKVGKKAKQYQEENKQRRRDEEMKNEQERWNIVRKAAEPSLDKGDYIPSLESIDAFLTNSEFPQVRHPALMMKAKCCFGAWQDKRYGDPTANDMKYPVLLMETVQRITQEDRSEEAGKLLTDKEKKKLSGYMMKLGFEEIAETFAQLTPGRKERAGDQFSVHQTSARFQLDHMGHLLKRDDRSDPDTRVDGFIPDTWQRKLLDAVDNKESALIVAPTSSGKTYASYYCMEKVLEESNEGVVVYVSPTKALVNQVAATIYARFRKNQLPEGRSVYGIFTRDYRHNTLNSQILVTVPQCLEILFLSPRRQDWTRNVRYVIFDEVHCLGQEIGAEVWEHLLLLIRCPFLALSATIGNPNDLLRWLQAAQDFREQQDKQDNGRLRKSYKVRLVTCDERYSDLEKSIYLPSPSNGAFSVDTREYESSYDVTRTDEFTRLHPCAQLATKQLMENGFPGDMALTPKEALQLYDAMAQHWPGKESLKSLSPEEYFKEQSFIPKSCARQYEKELKKEFKSWADDRKKTKVEAVIRSLNSVFLKRKESADEEWSQVGMPSSGYNFVEKNFPKLVEQLKAQGKLPALVFSFDRVMCEKMATGLVRKFEEREEHLQEKDDAQRAKLAKDKKQREKAQKILKRQRDLLEKIKKGDRYHPVLEQVTIQEVKGKDSVVLNEPLPECTLAFTHGIGNEDLKKIIARIETSRGKLNKKRARTFRKQAMNFKALLRRGISYHHAGLDNKKRSCVEMLFRERYLQVVTATGTLALGIHMPCKTVVLAGDSPFLNSLQYRQMSGRAGRRGFDPVGNVVFFGIPYRKVQRLVTANIPWLVGNFPINVSLVLRLLLMTSKGDNKKDALTKALALLSHPFICQKHPKMENQIKKHFLFSVELLARLGLINIDSGAPQEMAGLATHLHYHEPANLVLVSFLQRGLFHKLCKRQRNDLSPRTGRFSEDAMRTMVLILNHLFARRYLHANFKRRLSTCPSSKVILEDLPGDFAEALQEYNDQVTGVFSQYLTTVAAELENDQGEENKLPLSGIEFPRLASLGETDEDCLIQKLGMSSMSFSACSSFAALSGNSDLKLSSLGKTPASAGQGLSSAVEVGLKKDDVSKGGKKNKKKKRRGKQTISTGEGSKTGSEENENDSMADRQQPIDYLLKIVRQDVYTDMNVVPTLPVRTYDSAGRLRHLNAYALDFYKHGSKAAIVKENGVKAGEVFNVLKDFCLTVKSISCSLEEWGPADDNVVLAFKQLAQEFEAKFRNQFNAEI